MNKIIAVAYGAVAYVLFLAAFTYCIGFLAGFAVPKNINSGTEVPLAESLLVNLGLLGLFAVQHTIMARPAFKGWFTRFVPIHLERSTFVAVASLLLLVLYWQWRPLPDVVWEVADPTLAGHKLYAPKGVGALYLRRGTPCERYLHGASHETGLRAGTENVAQIVGLGRAPKNAVMLRLLDGAKKPECYSADEVLSALRGA